MYQLMVKQDFVAQHFLTVPNCGPENEWHSHHFAVEILLQGEALNEHGYLVDIDQVNEAMTNLVERYKDHTLNDLPEFTGLNPSIEHFSRIFCTRFIGQINAENVSAVTAKIWEDQLAWSSYTEEL